MVRAVLVDRFKLVIRRESKEMPVYALLVAKGGPKLQRADIDEKDCPEASLNALGPISTSTPIPDVCHAFNGGMGRGLHAKAANMSDLVAFVENWTDRPLLDKTGIGPVTAAVVYTAWSHRPSPFRSGVRRPCRRQPDTRLLGEHHPPSTQPRRRQAAQPCLAHGRHHPYDP